MVFEEKMFAIAKTTNIAPLITKIAPSLICYCCLKKLRRWFNLSLEDDLESGSEYFPTARDLGML
jgi:hypothetical protein